MGRSNAVLAIGMLVFLGIVVGTATVGGLSASESSARVTGLVFAGIFAIPLLMLLYRLPRFLSPRFVIFDPYGLHIEHGKRRVDIPWQHIAALGIGHESKLGEAPGGWSGFQERVSSLGDGPSERMAGYLTDRLAEPLQISDKRRIALEIFPTWPNDVERFPELKPYWVQLPPPAAGLSAFHWRFPLPPVVAIAESVDRGAQMFEPQRWLGWFPRPWSGDS